MRQRFFLFVCIALFLALALSTIAGASIFISNPESFYNLGDTLDFNIKIFYSEDLNGFLSASLICDEKTNLMYFSSVILKKGREKNIQINFPVSQDLGACFVSVGLEDSITNLLDEENSLGFMLTDKINLNITVKNEKKEFIPLDEIKLKAKAVKPNNQDVEGTARILFNGDEYSADISKGKFSFSVNLDSDIAPGEHEIIIYAEDGKGNRESETVTILVSTIPTSLIIEASNESFLPGDLLMITPKLLDQSGGIIPNEVDVKLIFAKEKFLFDKNIVLLEEIISSSNSTLYHFPDDAEPGEYYIEAKASGFETQKEISVQEFEKLDVSVENDTLFVLNAGNIHYKKQIELEFIIQNQTTNKILDLDLDVGETKTFKLEAPKGVYEIQLSTDDQSTSFSTIPLTGSVVTTVELESGNGRNSNFFFFLFIAMITVLLVFALIICKKTKIKYNIKSCKTGKQLKLSNGNVESIKSAGNIKVQKQINEKELIGNGKFDEFDSIIKRVFSRQVSSLAVSSIAPALVYGAKKEISTLFVNIEGIKSNEMKELSKKDPAAFNSILSEYFADIVSKIKSHQGVADIYGNTIVVFFNVVKQLRHDISAVRTAQEIRNITEIFNKSKTADKYGILFTVKAGINTGLATISSISPDKGIKYTAIGSTVNFAKALGRKAQENEVLLTEKVYARASGVIKAKKISPLYLTGNRAIEVYALEDASSKEIREKHRWFIDRALGKKS